MLTKEKFDELWENHVKYNDGFEMVLDNKLLNSDRLFDDVLEYAGKAFDYLWAAYFEDEGVDWINWWMYERRWNDSLTARDAQGEIIPTETRDDIWEVVKPYLK